MRAFTVVLGVAMLGAGAFAVFGGGQTVATERSSVGPSAPRPPASSPVAEPADDPHAGVLARGTSPHAAAAPLGAGHGRAAKPVPEVKDGSVPKATGAGAHRVAEVHAKKQALSGRTVRVRGVVVKSTPGVLGQTFLHLRDGSGAAASQDDDLAVTTSATPEVGDTITVEGTVTVGKDIGAGYRFEVLVERANVTPG